MKDSRVLLRLLGLHVIIDESRGLQADAGCLRVLTLGLSVLPRVQWRTKAGS